MKIFMPAPKHTFAEQEKIVLDAAEQSIMDSSLIDFKMSTIAKNAGLSMGSVYKHIQSKEDVLVALAVRADMEAAKIIQDIFSLPFSLPAKIVSLNLVSQQAMYRYPFSYQLLTMVTNKDLIGKSSEKWHGKLGQISNTIRSLFERALIESIEKEELICDDCDKAALIQEFMLMHWAVSIGFPQIVNHPYDTYVTPEKYNANVGLSLEHPLIRAAIRMTNSYPWKELVTLADLSQLEQTLIELGLREPEESKTDAIA